MKLNTIIMDVVKAKMFWLFIFSIVNLLFMHYFFLFENYLEWVFLFSYAANFFSVLFDIFFVLVFALLFTRFRLKAALAVVYGLTFAWSLVNVLYVRFFHTYIPIAAFEEVMSLQDSMVMGTLFSGFLFIDLFYPISLLGFVWIYRKTTAKRIKPKVWFLLVLMVPVMLLMTVLSYCFYHYAHPNCRNNRELLEFRIKGVCVYVNDGGTPNLSRFHAGSIRTIAWDIYDLFANHELSQNEKQMVSAYCSDEAGRVSTHEKPTVQNVIFILLESFLSSPIDSVYDGIEVTPFLNSLKNDSNVFFNGKMKSDIACGESGDGQFLYMTGLLPLRHKMTVSMLKGKKYPALPRILSSEFNIKTTEIIVPTLPNMWQQTDANWAYGIDNMYSYNDIRGIASSNDITDKDVFRFASQNTLTEKEPFFSMILSLSTHSPYNNYLGADLFGGSAAFPKEYRNYLNTCHFTDQWLCHYICSLKEKGIYDRSLIVICADHPAHLDRLKMNGKIADYTPLFIINGNIDQARTWNGEFHQLDTFTTIVDLLCLHSWKGLGHTILDSNYVGSVNDLCYSVSKLIIEGYYFPNLDQQLK